MTREELREDFTNHVETLMDALAAQLMQSFEDCTDEMKDVGDIEAIHPFQLNWQDDVPSTVMLHIHLRGGKGAHDVASS